MCGNTLGVLHRLASPSSYLERFLSHSDASVLLPRLGNINLPTLPLLSVHLPFLARFQRSSHKRLPTHRRKFVADVLPAVKEKKIKKKRFSRLFHNRRKKTRTIFTIRHLALNRITNSRKRPFNIIDVGGGAVGAGLNDLFAESFVTYEFRVDRMCWRWHGRRGSTFPGGGGRRGGGRSGIGRSRASRSLCANQKQI